MKITERQLRKIRRESIARIMEDAHYGSVEDVLRSMKFTPFSEEQILAAVKKSRFGVYAVDVKIDGQEYISPTFHGEERAFNYAQDFTDALETVGFDCSSLEGDVNAYFIENGKLDDDCCGVWYYDEETGGFWCD